MQIFLQITTFTENVLFQVVFRFLNQVKRLRFFSYYRYSVELGRKRIRSKYPSVFKEPRAASYLIIFLKTGSGSESDLNNKKKFGQ